MPRVQWKHGWLIAIGVFAFLLLLLSVLEKPLDRPVSTIQFPYILSAKPSLVRAGESITITVSALNGTSLDPIKDSLIVVTPDGTKMQLKTSANASRVVYPDDFIPNANAVLGRYSVIFLPNNVSASAVQLSFDAVSLPVLTELFNFVFGPGLLVSFSLVGSVMGFLYQSAAARRNDSERVANEKAKWITRNMRNYVALADQDALIYGQLKSKVRADKPLDHDDAKAILYGMVQYYREYTEFLKKPGLFYFDDYALESFLTEVNSAILVTFKEIIGDSEEELIIFKDKRLSELLLDDKFKEFMIKTSYWLSNLDNAKRLYKNHLMHHHVLMVGINKVLLKTYSDARKLREDSEKQIAQYKAELIEAIEKVCLENFNDKAFFTLFDSKGKLRL